MPPTQSGAFLFMVCSAFTISFEVRVGSAALSNPALLSLLPAVFRNGKLRENPKLGHTGGTYGAQFSRIHSFYKQATATRCLMQ